MATGLNASDALASTGEPLTRNLESKLATLFPDGQVPDDFRKQVAGLGSLRKEYAFSWSQGGVRLIGGYVFVLLGVFFLLAMLRAWIWDKDAQQTPLREVLIQLGFISGVLGMGVYLLVNTMGQTKSRAFLCDEGVVFSDGKTAGVARWDDIVSVTDAQSFFFFEAHAIWPRRRLTLTDRNGGTATFTEAYTNVLELGNAIVEEVTRRQVPRMRERIQTGATVEFGRLALSSAGVSMDGQLLPWAEVASIKPGIYIEKLGRQWLTWGHVAEASVPNAAAFLQLAETFFKQGK
jgi:hypothetical protein